MVEIRLPPDAPQFPWQDVLAGVAAAVVLSLARAVVLRRPPPAETRVPAAWQRADVLALLLVTSLGLALRLAGVESMPVDNDEPSTLRTRSLALFMNSSDSRLHPPLPELIMAWVSPRGPDLDHARAVSVVAGGLTVALAFTIARRTAGRTAGVLAGTMLAVMPWAINASQLARGYALLALFVLLAHGLLTAALERSSQLRWTLYSCAVALSICCEYLALLPLSIDAALALWFERRPPARWALGLSFLAGLSLASFLLGIAAPWLVDPRPSDHSAAERLFDITLELGRVFGGALPLLGISALLALLISARFWKHPIDLRLAAQILAIAGLVLFGSLFTQLRPRYLTHALPLASVLLASAALRASFPRARLVWAALLSSQLISLAMYFSGSSSRDALRQARGTIAPALPELVGEPALPVAVFPSNAIGEPAWRLGKVVYDLGPNVDCPVRRCLRDAQNRSYYALDDAGDARTLLRRHPALFVLDRRGDARAPPGCSERMREPQLALFRCSAN
jgi:4-amino-4-deoxy-L-arabinose transferase-like glycosyltransferase